MSKQQPDNNDDEVRWKRWFLRVIGVLVLLSVAIAIPLILSARLRAGVERRIQVFEEKVSRLPRATAQLDVPFLRQEHALSCEVAALRMALGYRSVRITEAELLKKIGVDPTPRTGDAWGRAPRSSKGAKWGDPDTAFVGDVDGIMLKTGYGVHARPIGRVAGEYRKAQVVENGTPKLLTEEINAGNPIIIWGFIPGRGKPLSWTTLGGKEIRAVDGEHARVVIGYVGEADKPSGFLVLDPIYGEQYWTTKKLLENWEPLGKIGVIIY